MTERRKRYLVQDFQYKLVGRVLAYWVLYHIALWNFLFCWRLLARGGGNVWQEYQQFFWDFYPVLICFLIVVPAFAWDAVRFYHGIAGPLAQFRRAIANIAAEQPVRPIEIRATDQLSELQDDFNRMLDTLVHKNAAALTGHENLPAGCRDTESAQPIVEPPCDGNSQLGLHMSASLDNDARLSGRRTRSLIDKLWPKKERAGATAIEYCVIASLISVAIIGGAQMVGLTASASLEKSKTEIEEAVEAANDD